jgi:hypothetical protein
MQSNLTQLQYQQLQIQQQQQRLASMMQQKQRGFQQQQQQQPWDEGFNKQQQLFQMQQQQQQQRMLNNSNINAKDIHMMRPPAMLPPAQVPTPPQPAIVPVITTPATNHSKATLVKTDLQKKNLLQYEYRDETYQDVLNLQHKKHIELAQTKKRSIEVASLERRNRMQPGGPIITFGPGYQGYGNGKTGTRSRIRFPQDKKKRRDFKL